MNTSRVRNKRPAPPRRALLTSAILSSLALGACGGSGGGDFTSSGEASGMGLSPPDRLLQSRAIDRSRLRPVVTLSDGRSMEMQRVDDGLWSGTIQVRPGTSIELDILWLLGTAGGELELAGLAEPQRVEIAADGRALAFGAADYVYDRFDIDEDGLANFYELDAGRDPFVADNGGDAIDQPPTDDGGQQGVAPEDQPPGNVPTDEPTVGTPSVEPPETDPPQVVPPTQAGIDVYVPRISRSDRPKIDGKKVVVDATGRFTGEWGQAVQVDSSGVRLGIDHLMIDLGADSTDGTPWRHWAAMHDGESLYIVVTVEDDGKRLGDGPLFWQDDAVELYLDGDYSRNTSYDDADDHHLIVPLLEPGTNRSPNSPRIAGFMYGPNTSPNPPELDFATGPGIGPDGLLRANYEQDVYEFAIDLESANIVVGRPFGFEIQVNDDDDGGPRDSKWGWAHPSRGASDVDFTYLDPSYMGTLLLD